MASTSHLSKSAHPLPLSRSEVEALAPKDVHDVLARTLLVDGFDVVRLISLRQRSETCSPVFPFLFFLPHASLAFPYLFSV
jgi:hypothetical protein